MTASFLDSSRLASRFGVARPGPRQTRSPVSTSPHIKPWGAQRTKITFLWSSENLSAVRQREDYFCVAACFTIIGLPPPFTSGTAFQTANV